MHQYIIMSSMVKSGEEKSFQSMAMGNLLFF